MAGSLREIQAKIASTKKTSQITGAMQMVSASGVIHGVGFRPQKVLWQGIFCPSPLCGAFLEEQNVIYTDE